MFFLNRDPAIVIHAETSFEKSFFLNQVLVELLCTCMHNLNSCLFVHLLYLYCFVFVHLYSASHSTSLSEALPTNSIDTVSDFNTRKRFIAYLNVYASDIR